MNVANGSWNMVRTRLSPTSEFCSPSLLSRTYSGISSVAYGTIRIDRVTRNSTFLPGKREPCEGVAAEQRNGEREGHREHRDDDAVQEVLAESSAVVQEGRVVPEAEPARPARFRAVR